MVTFVRTVVVGLGVLGSRCISVRLRLWLGRVIRLGTVLRRPRSITFVGAVVMRLVILRGRGVLMGLRLWLGRIARVGAVLRRFGSITLMRTAIVGLGSRSIRRRVRVRMDLKASRA